VGLKALTLGFAWFQKQESSTSHVSTQRPRKPFTGSQIAAIAKHVRISWRRR
jgi:hypothetical protein